MSFALEILYGYVHGLLVQYNPIITLQRTNLNPGQNLTFVVTGPVSPTLPSQNSAYLFVVLVDSTGSVAATNLQGMALSVPTPSSTSNYYLTAEAASGLPQGLTQNGVEFAWKVPDNQISEGKWTVYASITGSSFSAGSSSPIWGSAAATVDSERSPTGFTYDLTVSAGFLGLVASIYQGESLTINSYRDFTGSHKRWFLNHSPWFVAGPHFGIPIPALFRDVRT
jgi:hypothetical protein